MIGLQSYKEREFEDKRGEGRKHERQLASGAAPEKRPHETKAGSQKDSRDSSRVSGHHSPGFPGHQNYGRIHFIKSSVYVIFLGEPELAIQNKKNIIEHSAQRP